MSFVGASLLGQEVVWRDFKVFGLIVRVWPHGVHGLSR